MNKLFGALVVGIAVAIVGGALYLGLWVMLVGGIVGAIEAGKATPVDSWGLALNIVRALFFQVPIVLGYLAAFLVGGLGVAIMADTPKRRYL